MNTPPTQESQLLHLQLSLPEINTILEALGELPFVRVHELIQRIQLQAQQQLSGPPEDKE